LLGLVTPQLLRSAAAHGGLDPGLFAGRRQVEQEERTGAVIPARLDAREKLVEGRFCDIPLFRAVVPQLAAEGFQPLDDIIHDVGRRGRLRAVEQARYHGNGLKASLAHRSRQLDEHFVAPARSHEPGTRTHLIEPFVRHGLLHILGVTHACVEWG